MASELENWRILEVRQILCLTVIVCAKSGFEGRSVFQLVGYVVTSCSRLVGHVGANSSCTLGPFCMPYSTLAQDHASDITQAPCYDSARLSRQVFSRVRTRSTHTDDRKVQ